MPKKLFDKNLKESYDALLKLQQKLIALRSGLREFEDIQDAVDRAQKVACVAVQSDAVYFQGELIRQTAQASAGHPLHDYPHPFCVLGLDQFELAVETARSQGKSLYSLIEEHWEKALLTEQEAPVDEFGQRQ